VNGPEELVTYVAGPKTEEGNFERGYGSPRIVMSEEGRGGGSKK
jgi:hypothetical protein